MNQTEQTEQTTANAAWEENITPRKGAEDGFIHRSVITKPRIVLLSKDIVDEMRRMRPQEVANTLLSTRDEKH